MSFATFVLHHSESIDPTLLDWIRDEIDQVLGLTPEALVLLLGSLIVAFPLAILWAARRQTRAVQTTESRR